MGLWAWGFLTGCMQLSSVASCGILRQMRPSFASWKPCTMCRAGCAGFAPSSTSTLLASGMLLTASALLFAAPVVCCRTLEVLEWENNLQENTFYHDIMAQGYQTRTWAETGDLDQVWARMVAARSAVLEALSQDTLHQALKRLLPCPPRNRYTAITMMPQPPGVLQRVAWAAQGLLARLTGGPAAAGAGAALAPGGAAAGGQLASSGSLQHEAELAAAAAAAIGATGQSGGAWVLAGAGQQQQRVLVGAGVAVAAVAGIAAVMLARSRK